ncbi:MAG: hypothetical protein JXO72_05345, partial [Vicinamibacteria bacterium]|nr:hypothetical protein [Vicinamibacteria bacterium]
PGLVDPFDVGKVELAIAVCIGRMCRTADRVESNRLARLLTSVITESERIEHARRQRERAA